MRIKVGKASHLRLLKKGMFFHRAAKNETSGFQTCKHFIAYETEGFQRAVGNPFGRAPRRETFCIRKSIHRILPHISAQSRRRDAHHSVESLRFFASSYASSSLAHWMKALSPGFPCID